MILIIIVITIMANVADLLLKVGADRAGDSLSDPLAIFLTPWIWMGAVLGIGAMALWVYILGRHHISIAYPVFVGVGFLNITLASWLYLHEEISPQRLAGTLLILAGIIVVHFQSRSATAVQSGSGDPATATESGSGD
ncbi:MAG: SMR family transporter [Thermoleophilia bacterium]|nr:SMR family transporter [Thermoleophilia bacterium]